MTSISRLELFQASIARLNALPVTASPTPVIYPGEIPTSPPLLQTGAGDTDPSGRVAPYVVAFGGGGRPDVEPDLGDSAVDLDWGLQLVCAAGFINDVLQLADRIHDHLFRWAPVVAGVVVGELRPPTGYDPGVVRRFDQVKPIRFELPLQYRLIATT